MKKFKENEKFYNSFSNDYDSELVFKYLPNSTPNKNNFNNENIYNDNNQKSFFSIGNNNMNNFNNNNNNNNHQQQSNPKSKSNLKERSKSKSENSKSSKFNFGGLFNWVSKYPDFFSQSEQYENPAMILDDDKLSSTDNNLKTTKTYKSESSILNNTINNTNKEFFSYKKLRAKERRNLSSKKNKDQYYDPLSRKNSVANLSDLESASQIPINLQNPSYLFEEQEGSVDLRSEYSYCAKNNIMDNSQHQKFKNFNLKNQINSWKEVF
jgi:hypothetical protein